MKDNPVTIIKNGKLVNVEENDLCLRDIVVVQAGDIVPADLRLTKTTGLEANEFDLTGEIMPVIKGVRDNAMLYRGSSIIKGSGSGIVVATGEQTEYGQITKQLWEQNETYKLHFIEKKYFILVALLLPPFIIRAAKSSNPALLILIYLISSVAFVLLQNDDIFRQWLISNETKKCGRYQIQIRDPAAFELLNQVDVVCFDKTGVLTTRQMNVKAIYLGDRLTNNITGSSKDQTSYLINIACALCNDVLFFEKLVQANAIDKALISFAEKNDVNLKDLFRQSRRIYEKPFDSENRYMACGYKLKDQKVYYFAKGDPDVVLNMCDSYLISSGKKKAVDFDFLFRCNSKISSINQVGNTVIMLAYASGITNTAPGKYTFLCLLELENSLQYGARETIEKITEKGIRSIMLTGDRAETAVSISKKCKIAKNAESYLTGRVIDKMALDEVARQSDYCSVFARLLPSQKGVMIRLFQRKRGHHVAMIGDGPNDGIALSVADVGISFIKNSSPIARRLSKILIHDIRDLPRLLEEAARYKKTISYLKIIRVLILIITLLGSYLLGWM